LDSGQQDNNTIGLENLSTPFDRSADKPEAGNDDDGDNDNRSPRPAKRQRPFSPRCEDNPSHNLDTALDGKTAVNGLNGQSGCSPSKISEDREYDGTGIISDGSNLANTGISTPLVSEYAPRGLQLCPQLMDANQEWEIREITGEEDVDGVPH
jgi:hypothetical protein